jgi:hypothetical protein
MNLKSKINQIIERAAERKIEVLGYFINEIEVTNVSQAIGWFGEKVIASETECSILADIAGLLLDKSQSDKELAANLLEKIAKIREDIHKDFWLKRSCCRLSTVVSDIALEAKLKLASPNLGDSLTQIEYLCKEEIG